MKQIGNSVVLSFKGEETVINFTSPVYLIDTNKEKKRLRDEEDDTLKGFAKKLKCKERFISIDSSGNTKLIFKI